MKINKRLLMAALASAVIVSAPQVKTYADTQIDDTKAVTEKLIDNQLAKAAQNADQKNSEKAQAENTADADEKQKQQESSELKEEKEINSKKTGFGSQALNHPAQATSVSNVGNEADNSGLEVSDEKPQTALQAGETATNEPNYTEDEAKIKDYDGSNRYKETDLQPGDTNQTLNNTDEKVEKDGFKFETKNPSETSPSKTEYGYEITIDKKTGQRTYTKVTVTDSGLISVDAGNKPMMGQGDKLTPESPVVTYNPEEDSNISASRRQRNLNYEASEETLKHINSKDNESTSFGIKDNYTTNNPGTKFFGDNFGITYKVNPWPNENDKLQELKLNGQYNEKVFIQGQDIDTGVKVDNIDASAKERLVGQVYHPITGEIVPGARAYIGDDGNIHIQMPQGALKQDETGKYVVNEESIFSTDDYKGLQSLDVKFFARPRTKGEFENVANMGEEWDKGTYVETGAGTADINHKGNNVTIDKQGIDRYDHYNLIGGFKLNLDDTRYYTQKFVDGNNEETDDHKFSRVYPGQDFEVKINNPAAEETDKTRKTGSEMDDAYKDGQASGKLNEEFLEVANKQIAENLGVDYDEFISNDEYKDNRWSIDGSADNISHFKIHAPKNAKAGDFLAVPVEYTYTNGSTDTHWFHFVVQETNNNRPEYLAEVGPQGNTLVNNPIVPKKEQDLKKNQPESYELIGNTFKDNKGNVWNVSIDQKTGAVTATLPTNLPEGKEINGGEKLTVPVKVKYTDQTTGEERTEEIKAQFIATKQHKTQTSEKLTSEIPFETKVEYDPNLPEGYFQEFQAGQKGELTTTFIQDTLNGKKGLFQTDGTFIEGDRKIESTVTREATPRIIKIGTMPSSTTIEIPFDTEYEVDDTLAAGETKIVNDGEKGEVTITTSREQDGSVTINKETTKEAKNKKIKIGTKTQGEIVDTDKIPFKYKVEFDREFYKNYPDATENYKIVTPGKEGENTKTWTIVNSEKVGDPKIEITEPIDAVIKVGQKDYNGTVTNTVTKEIPYTVKVVKNPELEAGKSNVKQKGVAGSRTYEYTGEIVNGNLKEGSTFTEKELTDKYIEPKEEIIEIGTKPADNQVDVEKTVDVIVEYVYDSTKEKGYRNIEDLVPGKVITKVVNKYNPETGKIESKEETIVIPGTRRVTFGTKDFNGEYEEVNKNIVPYETKIVFDNTLAAGDKIITQAGVNGETVTKTKKHLVNGEVVSSDDPVTEETKKVQNQIIKVGTMTEGKHSHEEKIPFKYEIEYDSNLKAGEYVVDVEGKEGSRTTEWTIKNSEVVEGSASVTKEEAPINAKIRVGNKDFVGNISHEVTEEIPYDVKIVEDPDMIAGTSEVVTQGVAGSKTTKYTQGIKNGEKDGDLQSEVTAETKPTQQVIKVGTKPAENNKDYSKEVGVKVEYVYDSSLKMGVFKDGGLTPGKVETKIVNKYDPATGKITTTEKEVVTEAVQKIIVGTQDFTGKYPYESTTEIPFKVVVKEDPNLAKGQSRVEQEGKAGSKTTYYEIAIKNGEKVGDPVKIREVENDQPLDHIIYVGTAVAKSSTVETVEKDIPYETKIIYDDTLDAGSKVVDKEGVVGKEKVTVTTNITDGNGETSKTTETIKDKVDREVRIGVKPVTKVVEKPFNTEYVYDENLESGKTEEVTPGKNGKVTITTTYDKDQKKVVTSETEEKGQNRVVKIGGKTNGTEKVKEEIPFEVEVKKDPSLKKGEWKYATDEDGKELRGEKGEQEKTLTIVNSKVTETSDPTVTKQPKKAVILVGDEDFTGEVTNKVKEEIPFKVKVVENPNLESGKSNVKQVGQLGSREVEYTGEIVNGKLKDGTEFTKKEIENSYKEPVEHIIEIGTKPVEGNTHDVDENVNVEIEYVYDENLEKGKVVTGELTPGKVTSKQVNKVVDGKVVTEEVKKVTPAKQIVKVGTKDFTGTFETKKTKAVEFETEYIVDETLEPGKTVVDKEGKLGEEEITVTHTIVNGKVTKSEESKPVQTKAPEKRIVRVGKKPSEGETTKTIERQIPFDTKVIYDETLEAGSQVIEKEGKLGKEEVTITQKVKDSKPDGEATETTKTITEKEDRVVRVGTKPVTKETELPNDTEYRHNPDLKAGETKVIEEGSKGSVKYTTKFNKETGKLEITEERTEPTNKVVEYGSKTEGEFKYESEKAYDIIIRENPNLEVGKTNVIQEGIVGKTETTVKIENSKEVSRDTKTITEKQDKIIEIGTKNVCEIPPVDPDKPDPDKPGEKDPENPDKPGDKDPENPTKPGDKDPENPIKPGEKDPEKPGTPGEKPNEPGTPGEKPNEPGIPGETPEENGKTPENNGKTPENNGKTPDNQAGDTPTKPNNTPKTPETTEQVKGKEKADTPNRESAKKLPKAGSESEIMMLSMSALMTAAGFAGLKKKRKDR